MSEEVLKAINQATLKAHWAKKRSIDLEAFMKAFRDRKPYTVTLERNPKTGGYLLNVGMTEPMPANIPLMIGEILHAQRSVLDYLWMGLVRTIDPDERTETFPIKKSVDALKESIQKRFKDTPLHAFIENALISEIRAYSTEADQGPLGRILYALKELDNWDKHNLIITTLGVTSVDRVTLEGDSIHDVTIDNLQVTGNGKAGLIGFSDCPNLKITNKPNPTFEIIIEKHGKIDGGLLFPMLLQFSQAIDKVLELFRAEFIKK
jgi:hypothetical protein